MDELEQLTSSHNHFAIHKSHFTGKKNNEFKFSTISFSHGVLSFKKEKSLISFNCFTLPARFLNNIIIL